MFLTAAHSKPKNELVDSQEQYTGTQYVLSREKKFREKLRSL